MTKSTLAVPNGVVTMSSLDFLNNIINPSRKEAGENLFDHLIFTHELMMKLVKI